jgi:ADP-heptose:LPS heptosyltransferase
MLFKHAGVTLVCEHQTTSLVKMIPGLNVIEYDLDSSKTFARQFTGLAKEFRGIVDICFLLDHKPDLSLLYLAGASAAPARVGYYGAGKYPFLNLQVSPSKHRKYIPDLNCSISDLFGAKPEGMCWSVAPKILDEIDHLLRESKIKRKGALIGVDILFLSRKFGQGWTEQFLSKFKELKKGELYLYADHGGSAKEIEWIKAQKLPVLAHLSESRTAALVSRSDLIITGNTFLYVVAGLLNRPAVGFFHETEIESYCPNTAIHKGISFKGISEKENIRVLDKAISLIESFQPKFTANSTTPARNI